MLEHKFNEFKQIVAQMVAFNYDKRKQIELLIENGKNAYLNSRYERAYSFLSEASLLSKIYREIDLEVGAESRIAIVYHFQKDYLKAETHIHQYLSIAIDNNLPKETAECYDKIGFMKANKRRYAEAESYHLKAAEIYEQHDCAKELGIAYFNIAYTLKQRNKLEQAQKYYLKAIEYSEKADDKHNLIHIYLGFNNLKNQIKSFKDCFFYLEKALEICKEIGFKTLETRIKSNIGNLHLSLFEYDKAIESFHEVIADPNYEETNATALNNLGLSYKGVKDFDNAKKYLIASFEKRKANNQSMEADSSLLYLAELYTELNELDKSANCLREVKKSIDELPSELLYTRYYKCQHQFYAKMQNYEKAYQYALLLEEENLKVYDKQRIKELTQRDADYKMDLMEKENQANKEQVLLEKALMNDLHHRIKNYLSIFDVILSMQEKKVSNKASKDAFREMKLRAQTMATLHLKLYENSENNKKVNYQEYISEIVALLVYTYQKDEDISVVVDIPTDIALDMDEAMPICLIVNELVVNSLKHAHEEGESGTIGITFESKKEGEYLYIYDDGKGMPDEPRKKDSFGLKIINNMLTKIKGEIQLIPTIKGTKWELKYQKKGTAL